MMDEKEKKAIQKRRSYQNFKEWLEFLKNKPKPVEVLEKLHTEIDGRKGYGSQTNAMAARQSLDLIKQETA